jgi:hypothetical protein
MPRDVNDVYSKPSGTTAVANETITSTQFNSTTDDIVQDLNAPRPLSAGGTGATSASTARTALDVAQQQSSTSDTTAGRGLIVGGFGIGGTGVVSTDLNAAVYTGVYNVAADTANTPDTVGPGGSTCIVTRYDSTNLQQIFVRRGSTTAIVGLHIRQLRNGGWGAWSEVFTTVSAPFGTGVNGAYQRLPSGLQICTYGIIALPYISGGSCGATWTFPAAFSTTSHLTVHVTLAGGASPGDAATGAYNDIATPTFDSVVVGGVTTTAADIKVYRIASTGNFAPGDTAYAWVSAIGRWV